MICGGENVTSGCHLAFFGVVPHPLLTLTSSHPIEILVVMATPVKLSKMVGNSANYSVYTVDTMNYLELNIIAEMHASRSIHS